MVAPVTKICLPWILYLLSTCSLTVHKYACVSMLQMLKEEAVSHISWWIAPVCFILLPYVLSIINMWNVPILIKPAHRIFPKPQKLILDLLTCVLEPVCLISVSHVLLTTSLPGEMYLMMSCLVLAAPHWTQMWTGSQETEKVVTYVANMPVYLSLLAQCVLLPASGIISLYVADIIQFHHLLILLISLPALSLSWRCSPGVYSGDAGQTRTSKHLHYFYMSIKILVIIIIFIIITSCQHHHVADTGYEMWYLYHASGQTQHKYLVMMTIVAVSAILFKYLSFHSVPVCLSMHCLYFPSLSSTLVTFVITLYAEPGPGNFSDQVQTIFGMTFTLAVVTSVIVMYILGWPAFIKLSQVSKLPNNQSCSGFGWNFFLLDLETLLSVHTSNTHKHTHEYTNNKHEHINNTHKHTNNKHEHTNNTHEDTHEHTNNTHEDTSNTHEQTHNKCKQMKNSRRHKPTIFVCVTMFREDKSEMATLLNSLIKLAESSTSSATFSFHVFFDDGCSQDILSFHSSQFLTLLLARTSTNFSSIYLTPYGLQCRGTFASLVPIVVHFKDRSKFKCKKRWSQAMYMQYILKFCSSAHERGCGPQSAHERGCDPQSAHERGFGPESVHIEDFCPYKKACNMNLLARTQNMCGSNNKLSNLHTNWENIQPAWNDLKIHRPKLSKADISHDRMLTITTADNNNNNKKMSHTVGDSLHSLVPVTMSWNTSIYSRITQADDDKSSHELLLSCENNKFGEDTYVLVLDGDVQFEPSSVWELYQLCHSDRTLGGVCGRTYPQAVSSDSLVVWYQKIEYSFDFWATKSTQNVFGSVTCCPGCFSLFRVTALRDIVDTVCEPTMTATDMYLKDIGEDRWITSLMIFKGWNMKYVLSAQNFTYCPANFPEFMRQRKRWILSDLANELLLLSKSWTLVRTNRFISASFLVYTFLQFVWKLQLVSSMIFMMALSTNLMFGADFLLCTVLLTSTLAVYVFCCLRTSGITLAKLVLIYGTLFGVVCAVDFFFILYYMAVGMGSQDHVTLSFLIVTLSPLVLLYAAALHPWDLRCLLYLPVYLIFTPLVSMLLPVYSICQTGDRRWGTRDGAVDEDDMKCCGRFLQTGSSVVDVNDEQSETKPAVSQATMTNLQNLDTVHAAEAQFWANLGQTTLGTQVNTGCDEEELSQDLSNLRKFCLTLYILINGVLLAAYSTMHLKTESHHLPWGSYYFHLLSIIILIKTLVPVVGMTLHHLHMIIKMTAQTVYGDRLLSTSPRSSMTVTV